MHNGVDNPQLVCHALIVLKIIKQNCIYAKKRRNGSVVKNGKEIIIIILFYHLHNGYALFDCVQLTLLHVNGY
jgi:hypothetical protein